MKNQELIKVEEREGIKTVNARELHNFLESKQQFGNWILSRIEKYDFEKDVDFTINKFINRKATVKDYRISIDMAKELSMVENNSKGKEARKYFIEMEKVARGKRRPKVPTQLEQAKQIVMLLEQREADQKLIEQQSQKIDLKTDLIEGFTENVSPYRKRHLINRTVKQASGLLIPKRYSELYKVFKETFHVDLKVRSNRYNETQNKKKDQLNPIAYAEKFNFIDDLYLVACKLFETDMLELLQKDREEDKAIANFFN